MYEKHTSEAFSKWTKILKAKGYGSAWKNWIISFDCVQAVPIQVPDIELMLLFDQITEHDCIHACRAEAKFRADKFKSMMIIDQADHFCKTIYKIVRSKSTDALQEVPAHWKIPAILLRSKVGSTAMKLHDARFVPPFAKLRFGDANVEYVKQEGEKLFFRHIDGCLPVSGDLHVSFTAITVDAILVSNVAQRQA